MLGENFDNYTSLTKKKTLEKSDERYCFLERKITDFQSTILSVRDRIILEAMSKSTWQV